MKTVAIISSVFALATVIYSADPIALQKFRKNYKNCAQMMNVSTEAQIQVALCAVIQEGDIIYANGEYNKNIILGKFEKWISNPVNLQRAQEKFLRCDYEATRSGAYGIAKTMQVSICVTPVISLIMQEM
ncbi:uncharacterized protein LOC116853090 isoform X1 [Odontomachus brunneus]|uniref:uncharacterized protein LOC116853090 isoform X1 n=1 Tax=Odontomachus brunneus TaxID=486640 RepID=UPI0013F1A7A6|nr:uncharacterized protein LOC116853090 isoform X1 [Odontomachus brunneus]XP_032689855.1 uncharacterized protein LOC116853090 isoform X1 [Odontomachus brunneus]